MKTKFLLSFLFLLTWLVGYSETVIINNNGFSFSPSSITISSGDAVNFVLAFEHNAVEVSQATWNNNQANPLSGGFSVPLGGGLVSAAFLEPGIHYYVCQPHASMGMKGRITVTSLGIEDVQFQAGISLFPNPTSDLITVKGDNISDLPYVFVDSTGRQVLKGELNEISESINISHFSPGIYFLQLGVETRKTYKVIKE